MVSSKVIVKAQQVYNPSVGLCVFFVKITFLFALLFAFYPYLWKMAFQERFCICKISDKKLCLYIYICTMVKSTPNEVSYAETVTFFNVIISAKCPVRVINFDFSVTLGLLFNVRVPSEKGVKMLLSG